jgi:hypothetical protein
MSINRPNREQLRKPVERPFCLRAEVHVRDRVVEQMRPLPIKA